MSTARSGYVTPRGQYRPQALATMHYSRKYHMSPMPHSIFFNGGYAIHGTNDARNLGRPASHGCVRLSKANAATLFALVKAEGARIAINGAPPHATMLASTKKKTPVLAKAAPTGGMPASALGYVRYEARHRSRLGPATRATRTFSCAESLGLRAIRVPAHLPAQRVLGKLGGPP